MKKKEELVSVVRAYSGGDPDSLVVVIPRDVRVMTGASRGTKFSVKVDERRRIIYEPIKETS